ERTQEGRWRRLELGGQRRARDWRDVPAMPEIGFPAVSSGAWTALMAPRDTPPGVLTRLNEATNAALNSEPMKSALAKLGAQPRGGSPQNLADHIQREIAKWTPIVSSLNLKTD